MKDKINFKLLNLLIIIAIICLLYLSSQVFPGGCVDDIYEKHVKKVRKNASFLQKKCEKMLEKLGDF